MKTDWNSLVQAAGGVEEAIWNLQEAAKNLRGWGAADELNFDPSFTMELEELRELGDRIDELLVEAQKEAIRNGVYG